ncbi:MAG: hypothetical protein BroJett030_22980 [Alphaproteobacteria bacterium]|nr:MAG: hypothetical protein BroJett030_22980 [Alphaproteobacteria bacterium]
MRHAFRLAFAICTGIGFPATPVFAESFKGVCTITAGAVSGKRYATLKCYKSTDPGNYTIRSTQWERDDAKAYRDMARFSGRRFTCTFSRSGSGTRDDQVVVNYKMSGCR